MGFRRHEYQHGLPFSSPGDLPDPGILLIHLKKKKKKKNEMMPFSETWMDLEIIILSEVSQKRKYIYHKVSLIYVI